LNVIILSFFLIARGANVGCTYLSAHVLTA